MHGARTYTSLTELIIPDDGARIGATMAALVEDARWRTSARGKRYMMAQLSDATGQFLATCFDDSVAADLEKAAKEGDCALITVELDRRPGEEAPRVSIKRVQLFDGLASMAKFVVEVTVTDKAAFPALRAMLDPLRNGRGEVRARIVGGDGDTLLTLGRNFLLDAELASHIEDLPGVKAVAMKSSEARLALVG